MVNGDSPRRSKLLIAEATELTLIGGWLRWFYYDIYELCRGWRLETERLTVNSFQLTVKQLLGLYWKIARAKKIQLCVNQYWKFSLNFLLLIFLIMLTIERFISNEWWAIKFAYSRRNNFVSKLINNLIRLGGLNS